MAAMTDGPDKSKLGKKRPPDTRIRPLVIAIAVIGLVLALLFSIWAVIGVRTVRGALVAETDRQSRALLQSLILASQYSLSSGALVDRLEREAMAERVRAMLDRTTQPAFSASALPDLTAALEADGISVWLQDTAWAFPRDLEKAITTENALDLTAWHDQDDAIALEFADSASGQIWSGVGFSTDYGEVVVWRRVQSSAVASSVSGIGELIQEVGRQSGVNYIMLQAPDGIVFASRPLKPVLKLAADSFLVAVLEADTPATRETVFEGTPVLEAAAPFLSTELPSGMFRVGLSLTAVDDAVQRLTLQLGITALLLLLLSSSVAGFLVARRSLADLGQSYRQVETLTGRVLDSIDQAVIAVNADGNVTIVNPTAEKWFSISLNALRGKALDRALAAAFEIDAVRLSGNAVINRDHSTRTPRGDRLFVYSTTPLVTRDSARIGAVAVIRDETESRALAEKMRRAERLSAMGQLAAGVAHEIRNPLNAIALAAQQLKLDLGDSAASRLADTIWGESKRLNGIVEEFLSLARPSTRPKERLDWTELVESVTQMAAIEADKKQVELRLDHDGPAVVSGVADELRKALWNLLHNSLAATSSGGSIAMTLRHNLQSTVLTIDDSGSGIPPDALPRIFEPWFTTKAGGTGLGLAITHRIVEDHNGTVDIQSPVPGNNRGTRVVVKLPTLAA